MQYSGQHTRSLCGPAIRLLNTEAVFQILTATPILYQHPWWVWQANSHCNLAQGNSLVLLSLRTAALRLGASFGGSECSSWLSLANEVGRASTGESGAPARELGGGGLEELLGLSW